MPNDGGWKAVAGIGNRHQQSLSANHRPRHVNVTVPRYEIAVATIFILRLWHCGENRRFESGE